MNDKLIKSLKKICASKEVQVFVYETLLNEKIRKKILKRDVSTYVDRLIGYREVNIESNEGPNHHTLLPDETSSVTGKRFAVTPKELKALDIWEDEYARKKVQLTSGTIAWVYFLKIQNMSNKGRNLDIPN